MKKKSFAAALMEWYRAHRRDLPWRRGANPYRIWVSEIMLQQTRVETVLAYYEKFLSRYPDVESLAAADEQDLLAVWAGLGYYSRARNMQLAARQIAACGEFPRTYQDIRKLAGIGDYTAAALSSIAFGTPHAALDGNVMRVMARILNYGGNLRFRASIKHLQNEAGKRLDASDPGTFNQAMMELGATICTPRNPKCSQCPVQRFCEARREGCQHILPVKSRACIKRTEEVKLLIVLRGKSILLWRRPPGSGRLAGFWDLPEGVTLARAQQQTYIGTFQHGITNTSYTVAVWSASLRSKPVEEKWKWIPLAKLPELPLTTMSRKALTRLEVYLEK